MTLKLQAFTQFIALPIALTLLLGPWFQAGLKLAAQPSRNNGNHRDPNEHTVITDALIRRNCHQHVTD